MFLLQLDPSIPVITPKGDGYAHILIDYGAEFNLLWVVFLDDSGECGPSTTPKSGLRRTSPWAALMFRCIKRRASPRNSRVMVTVVESSHNFDADWPFREMPSQTLEPHP